MLCEGRVNPGGQMTVELPDGKVTGDVRLECFFHGLKLRVVSEFFGTAYLGQV